MKHPPELHELAERLRRAHVSARPTAADAVAWLVVARIVEQRAAAILQDAVSEQKAA